MCPDRSPLVSVIVVVRNGRLKRLGVELSLEKQIFG
jgi:hypothetical protein